MLCTVVLEESNTLPYHTLGTSTFIQEHPQLLQTEGTTVQELQTTCSKELGVRGRLRHRSRGHLFICRPCGHIDLWRPIYKFIVQLIAFVLTSVAYLELNHHHVLFLSRSESPSQVFVIVVEWLYEVLQHLPEDKWEQLVIAYDNMCHLNSLRAAQSPLPLPPPYDQMWIRVTKV